MEFTINLLNENRYYLERRCFLHMDRRSGILMHITSLPGKQGCGTLGKEAYSFVDFLQAARQSYWQILPTCPTDDVGSPYHSYSARAGCHLLVDLEPLVMQGFISEEEISPLYELDEKRVDYIKLGDIKESLLRMAYERSRSSLVDALRSFYEQEKSWLADYALFMALRGKFGLKPWYEWDEGAKRHDEGALYQLREELHEDIGYYVYRQYLFYTQWWRLREYANNKGIKIIGDLPIYVAGDSADVWANQRFFELGEDCRPIRISGCPPDAFSPDGQLWNNPLYRWDVLQQNHYCWWIDRLRGGLQLYDVLRLDHFRGFDAYWAVPAGEPNAKNGSWVQGPGMDLFRAVCWQMGIIPVIAEDLGFITEGVAQLRAESGFPGMRVLQFAFDGDPNNLYLPHNYDRHCVAYTGTHDNNTTIGWQNELSEDTLNYVREYLGVNVGQSLAEAAIRWVWSSKADLAIAPIQDFLGLDGSARMNAPGTTVGNWSWRVDAGMLSEDLAKKICRLTCLYSRNPN